MSAIAPRGLYVYLRFVPQAASALTITGGALVLIGWIFDIVALKGVLPSLPTMKVNTAIGFILCGVALWTTQGGREAWPRRLVGQACCVVVLLLGVLTLGEYATGFRLGIDQLLIPETTALPGEIPGRMAVQTAIGFCAVSAALRLAIEGKDAITAIHGLLLAPIVMAGSALIGYGYDIALLHEKLGFTPMSLPAATLFILLALGITTARPEYPLRRFVASNSPAGVMVRRLLPALIVFTVATGWLIDEGFDSGYFGEAFGVALFSTISIAGLAVLVVWSAKALDAAEARRRGAEQEVLAASTALQKSEERMRRFFERQLVGMAITSPQKGWLQVNDKLCQMLGYSREELANLTWAEMTYPEDLAPDLAQFERLLSGEIDSYTLEKRFLRKDGSTLFANLAVGCVRRPDRSLDYALVLLEDITERKQNEAVNAARLHLVQFAVTHTLDELLEETLNEAERLTGSLIGFYHFVEDDQNSLTLQTWSTRTKAEFCRAEGSGLHYPIADAGVWADCARQGKPVIHNDYAALPYHKGMPQGHATVVREAVVPVQRGEKLSAIMGVGNKATDYTQRDVELLLLVADLTGEIAARKRVEEALRKSADEIEDLYNRAPMGYHSVDKDGIIVRINDTELAWLGYTRDEVIGKNFADLLTPESRAAFLATFEAFKARGWESGLEFDMVRKDGTRLPVLLSETAVKDAQDNFVVSRSTIYDNTERKKLEAQIWQAAAYTRSLIEVSLDPLVTISPDGKITDVNEATIQATGMPRTLIVGSDFSNYFTEPDKARAVYQQVFEKGFVTDYPLTLRHVSGKMMEVLYNATVYRDAAGNVAGVFAAARDVTERRKLERELERQAHIDLLTDLNNRRYFLELSELELARSKRHAEPLSLLMLDVDHFKMINDTYGHDVGDAVLQRLGEICRHTFREIDIVGRVGGEEFAALLPEADTAEALEVAERLRASVEGAAVKLAGGSLIRFTVSIGVASFQGANEKIEPVLKRADNALYQAKNSGRNRVCCESTGADSGARKAG